MSAVEVIERFKQLPQGAQTKVKEFVNGTPMSPARSSQRKVDEEIKSGANQVFIRSAGLYRKLAR